MDNRLELDTTVVDVLPTSISQDSSASLESRYLLSLLLEPNSLVILQDDMYRKFLHGIATDREEDSITDSIRNLGRLGVPRPLGGVARRSTRVSLTIRHVPKTLKVKLKLGK